MMKYVDLHCDTLTACLKSGGKMKNFCGHVNLEKLKSVGCAAQCFAIFTQGDGARRDFEECLKFYNAVLRENAGSLLPVFCYADFAAAERQGKIGSVLTVENLGFAGGSIGEISRLQKCGVKMVSLVWNTENDYAYPNLIFRGKVPDFSARESRGLKKAGKEAVEALNENKIIIDVSHLSDGGLGDILEISSCPIVASHSNAHAVCGVSRNLTDEQIKAIADKGGVIGVNFCADFVGGDGLDGVMRHVKHIINIGGEDVSALGSDFDGIPAPQGLEDCSGMPKFFEAAKRIGLSASALEKLAYKNFYRVFASVCG